jgi:hypothetical protein
MMFLFFFQDLVGFWGEVAKQGIAIAVLALILFFVIILVVKILPTWERVKKAESEAMMAQAKSLGELGASQTQLTVVIKDIAVEQKQSTDAVKILQRVNAASNNQLASDVQTLTETTQSLADTTKNIVERLDLLEQKDERKS